MMMKANDYLNDPRILHDQGVMAAPRCIREIHAIRLKIQDETANMTAAEKAEYNRKSREKVDAECARIGVRLQYVNSAL